MPNHCRNYEKSGEGFHEYYKKCESYSPNGCYVERTSGLIGNDLESTVGAGDKKESYSPNGCYVERTNGLIGNDLESTVGAGDKKKIESYKPGGCYSEKRDNFLLDDKEKFLLDESEENFVFLSAIRCNYVPGVGGASGANGIYM
jgi:hypothetical protein